ncbi:cytidine deaminase-like protein [Phycomyces nitens]|nr:cytidine deaminase-like protein [Phycomyces nitens]
MFIGLTGTKCSGKHAIADYLVKSSSFRFLSLKKNNDQSHELYSDCLMFDTLDQMQIYVTERWREDFVTCDIEGNGLWILKKRPFFLLVSVEAPMLMRYKRYTERSTTRLSLEEFVAQDDRTLFQKTLSPVSKESVPLHILMSHADVTVTNDFKTLNELHNTVHGLQLTNTERLRPSWDTYFMHLSDLASRRSNCMKRRVGCILVKHSRVIATGYNGTPRGLRNCNEGGCDRCNEAAPCGTGLDRCLCMHAEENALLEAGRGRVDDCEGTVLYTNTCPCLGCAIKIVQQGIKEVVYAKSYGMDQMTAKIFKEANVKLRQHSPPPMRLEFQADICAIDGSIQGQLEWSAK